MAILSKLRFKYSIMPDVGVLVILIVMQSLLHEASHALAVIILGGDVDIIAINAFDPAQSYVAYRIAYSNYSELYQVIIKLLPHLLLGIIGSYLVHKGINRTKLAGKDAVDKYTDLLIGLLYLGIGIWWFLPLKYLNVGSYQQFDIPQAALHLSNFAHRHLPEQALILINLPPSQFQIRLLIFGLIGVSGMIYAGLWLSLGQGDHNLPELQRGAMVGFGGRVAGASRDRTDNPGSGAAPPQSRSAFPGLPPLRPPRSRQSPAIASRPGK
jgi:hypothetical protein